MNFDPVKKASAIVGYWDAAPTQVPTAGVPDGPLFGNGDIGVTAGMEGSTPTLWLSKNDFWYASHAHHNGGWTGGVKCFGTLQLQSKMLQNAAFSAKQFIGTADVEIALESAESRLLLRAYAPYQQNLIIANVTAEKGDIPLQICLHPLADAAADCTAQTDGNCICVTKDYVRDAEWETKAAACCRILEWNGTEGILHQGERITLIISLYTNHDSADYQMLAKAAVSDINRQLLAEYRTAHEQWWQQFWSRSGICIPSEPEVERFWYGSHYLMACCSKGGKFAPGIFGNWITTNNPNWAGDYHLNYNYEAPWWGVFSSNKVELSEPYDKPLLDYIPQAEQNAKERLNCRGLYSKVGIGPMGLETSRMYNKDGTENHLAPYWGQKSNSSYAAINMMMRFYSTWDAEYAANCALPYLRKVADFWEDYLKFEDGRYVIYNDCIHENSAAAIGIADWVSPDTPDYSDDFNPILSLGLVRLVFKGLLDMSEYLHTDADRRAKWEHILTHISDFPTQTRDSKTVFRYTERGMDWKDNNSLGIQHIFPCGAIGLNSDKKMLEIARNTVTVMHRWSDYNAFPTFFTAAARVGYDPNIILTKFKEQFLTHSFPNLFIYYGGGGIECCSAVPGCINEMLFQSHENVLRFFPVWDKQKDAAFYHLRGYGAFVVSAELKNGTVQDITLFSEKGRPCAVLCPWESGMTVTADGKPVACEITRNKDGAIYRFKTMPDTAYLIQQKE